VGDAKDPLATRVGERLEAQSSTLAVAESLTGGLMSSCLARVEGSGRWFRGGVVAYASEVKYRVLGVRPGPVVSEQAARQMASGAASLLESDVAVALTGVGGPDDQEGQPPGTVWIATWVAGEEAARRFRFDGEPAEVCAAACDSALGMLD